MMKYDAKKKISAGAKLAKDALYSSQREYYRETYTTQEAAPWDGAFDTKWLGAVLKEIGPARGRPALDIGTGRGKGLRALRDAGFRAVGIDYVLKPLIDARRGAVPGAMLVNGDLFAAPFTPASFDLILDWGVFHHIRRRDTKVFLDSVTSLMAPSGHFLLGCFSTKFRHKGEKNRKRNWKLHQGHYDRFSTKKELLSVFSPKFRVWSIEERSGGFYHLAMSLKDES